MMPTIGILALQGGYAAHETFVANLGASTILIRHPEQLEEIDGLIMPGGESTAMLKFLERGDFFDRLETFARSKPVLATCAGVILLAQQIGNSAQRALGLLDITVDRNAYGRQNESIIVHAPTTLIGGDLEMVFIRAPRITRTGNEVEILAQRNDDPVLVRQGNLLGATFHPELGTDPRIHRHFLTMVENHLSHHSRESGNPE